MTPILGFAPDFDSTAPGILTDCSRLVPTPSGYTSAQSPITAGLPALAAECRGAAVMRKLDNSKRIFAGTQTKLYQQSGSTWADVSRATNYTGGTDNRWRFVQFGDVSLAVNQTEPLQASSSGAFSDVAGSPKARLIESVAGFIMLAGTNEATYGDSTDRWWCSGLYDHTVWTPSIATQCATGRLVDAPGDIRALKRLGNDVVAYKERSMFIGSFVGAPLIWTWQQIPGEVGTPSSEAVINIGSQHVFIGQEDIYTFDGTRPVSIGSPVKQWFFRDVHPAYRYKIIGTHDRSKSLAKFYYVSANSTDGTIDSCLIYNYQVKKWGRSNRKIEACVEYTSAGLTYDSIGTTYGTWDSLPAISYDSPFWTKEALTPAVFDTSHTLMQLSGISETSSLTTGDMGDDSTFSTITRVVPRFLAKPSSATISDQHRDVLGDSPTVDAPVPMVNGRFDVLQSARWHRFTIEAVGDMEITGYDVQATTDGAF